METSAELWRAVWPRFGRIFALELALALGVAGAAWATLVVAAAPAMYKARFTQVWYFVSPAKLETIERVALDIAAGTPSIDDKRELTPNMFQRIEGTQVVLNGSLPGGPVYQVRFAPEVAPGSAVALWRCVETNLTGRWMPSQCRAGRGG